MTWSRATTKAGGVCEMRHRGAGREVTGLAGLLASLAIAAAAVADGQPGSDPPSYLVLKEIDRPRRAALERATAWTDEADAVVVKVLRRIDPPAALAARWRAEAGAVPAAGQPLAVSDSILAIRGRATFVAPRRLPAELAERLGQPAYDVVRISDEGGSTVDVLTMAAPREWPRWQPIDEPAAALALPLTTSVSVQPAAADGEAAWPAAGPGLVLAAPRVAWISDTPLGRLGMDYGLFDSVVDGRKLVRGDMAAFYALLAATGRTDAAAVAGAAGDVDVLDLIDPGRKWLPAHRGDPLVIEGTALRATRVAVDEAFARAETGLDHYWELFVFVETPLLEVDGRRQDTFPIVCCVRELSPGMPTGGRINERVRVPGFAFKRYAYSFEEVRTEDGGPVAEVGKRQTMLVVGPRAEWAPPTEDVAAREISMITGVAVAVALAAVLGLGILYTSWSNNRMIRRSRADLPDRIDVPPADTG